MLSKQLKYSLSMLDELIVEEKKTVVWRFCSVEADIRPSSDQRISHLKTQTFRSGYLTPNIKFFYYHWYSLIIAHLSRPWSIGWVALSFLFVRSSVRPAMVTSDQISTSTSPRPPNPYIFWKLMIIAIQKWIRNTNTKTKTNTKTMTKTKTPR